VKFHRLVFFFLLVISFNAFAQIGGTHAFPILNFSGSARVASMGGNYLAMKDGDLNLCIANPSLLDTLVHGKIALSYVDYFSGGNFGFASYAHTLNRKLVLAGTVQYMSFGNSETTDATGQSTGQWTAGDYVFNAGGGYQLDSLFSLGANVKFIYSNLAGQLAYGAALDMAATYHKPIHNFTASLVLRNAGLQLDSYANNDADRLPFEIQLGITKRLKHAPFRFNVVAENLQKRDLTYNDPNNTTFTDPITGEVVDQQGWPLGDKLMRHAVLGVEFIISENIQFRLGYNYRRRQELKISDRPGMAGFSYGVGFKVKRFHLSYGRAIYHLAGPSNHFSVATDLVN